MAPKTTTPRALLFDIGGVCVHSPMQAILDYEVAHSIPPGWVNFSISRTSPNGAWHQLERGEIAMDKHFFAQFKHDISKPDLWREHWLRAQQQKKRNDVGDVYGKSNSTQSDTAQQQGQAKVPPVPEIDAEALYWEMMRISRTPDAVMHSYLLTLQKSSKFLLAALSNTSIFPDGHPYNDPPSSDQDVKGIFRVFVSSAHVGLRKPDPPIYKLAMEWMRNEVEDLKESEVVFVDDIGANLKTARDLGMGTVKVGLGGTRQAVRELEAITGVKYEGPEPGRSKL